MRENGSSDLLNKLYDAALNKLEGMKKEYDALRIRYNEKTASHNADLSRLEQMEEENRRLQKQLDVLLKQRDTALHFQQQYSGSVRRCSSHTLHAAFQISAVKMAGNLIRILYFNF